MNAKRSFWITQVDTLEGSSRIRFDSIGNNYEIVEDTHKFLNRFLPPKRDKNIPLVPFETYELNHVFDGDAATGTIYLLTNKDCKVYKVMKKYEYAYTARPSVSEK